MIIKGEIDDAINQINEINSEILEANPSIYFELQKQKLIEIIKKNDIENALSFAQNKLFPIAQNNVRFFFYLLFSIYNTEKNIK